MKKLELTGQKFGRLTCRKPMGVDSHNNSLWLFDCECGNTIIAKGSSVKNGRVKSCGCLAREAASRLGKQLGLASKTHGMTDTRQYGIWCAMIRRCENKNVGSYEYYGGRGIRVCSRWHSFESFWEDMGPTYKDGLEIDRIDNDGDYCPENCRWVSRMKQMNNCSHNRKITHGGKTLTLSQWERETGIDNRTIGARLNRGWSVQKTLTLEPVLGRNQFGEPKKQVLGKSMAD